MKSSMKRTVTLGVVVGGALLAAGTAYAGAKGNAGVFLNQTQRYAGGSLADARSSADTKASISIEFGASPGYSSAWLQVVDAQGVIANCFTTNPAMVQAFQSIMSDGYVYATWDASAQCTYVAAFNTSMYSVKQQ